jgi:hypothetical protein
VFIDTGHLVCLSKVQRGKQAELSTRPPEVIAAYRTILEGIRLGVILPVIGFEQPYEWCPEGRVGGGREIASVLDLGPPCFEAADHVMAVLMETAREAVRILDPARAAPPAPIRRINEPDLCNVFLRENAPQIREHWRHSGLEALYLWCVKLRIDVGVRAFSSARKLVECSAQVAAAQIEGDRQSASTFRMGFWQTKDTIRDEETDPRAALLKRLLRTDLAITLLRGMFVGADLGMVWAGLDLARCPTLDLWTRLWWRYVKGRTSPEDSDAKDIAFLPAYCYADLALTERQMRHFIVQADGSYEARVFADPAALVAAIGL